MTGHLAGAKRFIELRKTIRKIFALGLILAGLIALLLVIFHNPIIALFSSEYIVVSEVRNMLMFIVICIITFPIIMGCGFVFLGLEKSLYTLIFIIFNLITLMTFIAVFTHVLGMSSFGIFSAIALSNLIEAIAMLLVLRKMLNTRISTYESVSGAQMA